MFIGTSVLRNWSLINSLKLTVMLVSAKIKETVTLWWFWAFSEGHWAAFSRNSHWAAFSRNTNKEFIELSAEYSCFYLKEAISWVFILMCHFLSSLQAKTKTFFKWKKKTTRVLFCKVLLYAWTTLMHLILPNVTDSQRMRPEKWFWNALILIEISIVVVDSLWIRSGASAAVLWHWSETIETVKSSFILCWTSCPLILVIGIHLPQILLCFLVKQLQFFWSHHLPSQKPRSLIY